MKKVVFWLIVVSCVHALPLENSHIEQPIAAQGCCMHRPPGGSWYQIGLNLHQCRSANQNQDSNDDLYQPLGRFWWNINC